MLRDIDQVYSAVTLFDLSLSLSLSLYFCYIFKIK